MSKIEWIKTSDRLPEIYEGVLVTVKRYLSKEPEVHYAFRKPYGRAKKGGSREIKWYNGYGYYNEATDEVIAWCKLPAPYEEVSDDRD